MMRFRKENKAGQRQLYNNNDFINDLSHDWNSSYYDET